MKQWLNNLCSKLILGFGICQLSFNSHVFAINHAASVEVGGNGIVYSLNYEAILGGSNVFRLGGGYFSGVLKTADYNVDFGHLFASPIVYSYLWGDTEHKFETGLGLVYTHSTGTIATHVRGFRGKIKSNGVTFTGVLGYRYLPCDRGVMFKAGFTPFFSASYVVPWVGASIGYVF